MNEGGRNSYVEGAPLSQRGPSWSGVWDTVSLWEPSCPYRPLVRGWFHPDCPGIRLPSSGGRGGLDPIEASLTPCSPSWPL